MRRAIALALFVALIASIPVTSVHAQQQEPPKEKKKPRKVWTEDDLKGLSGRINVVGTEAPPPPPAGQPAAATGPAGDTALWEELDELTMLRQNAQEQLDLNRRHLEALNSRLNEETDPLNIEELLEGRAAKEEEILQLQEELEQLNVQVAALEQQLAGRKRPVRPKPVKTEKLRPPAEGEGEEGAPPETEPPPAPAEEPAEEPPPPPPPPL